MIQITVKDQVSKKADFDSGFEFDKDIQSNSSVRGSVSSRIRNKSSKNPFKKKSKKSRAYDFDTGAYEKRKKKKITEIKFMEDRRRENEFLVLFDVNYLPRYKYHKSLLRLFKEGLPPNPVFHDSYFGNCSIIIGGEFDEESKLQVFKDTRLEIVTVNDSPEETYAEITTEVLMVYFFTGDVERMHQEIRKIS